MGSLLKWNNAKRTLLCFVSISFHKTTLHKGLLKLLFHHRSNKVGLLCKIHKWNLKSRILFSRLLFHLLSHSLRFKDPKIKISHDLKSLRFNSHLSIKRLSVWNLTKRIQLISFKLSSNTTLQPSLITKNLSRI